MGVHRIVLLLFGTTTLAQAFVIPTGSMENTLLVGDHLLVDRLAYAPPDGISKHLLPYTEFIAATSSSFVIRSTSNRLRQTRHGAARRPHSYRQ